MKATFIRHGDGFFPIGDDAHALLMGVKDGQEVMIEAHAPRNPKHHRLFFKLLSVLVENSEGFSTVEQALVALKIAVGHVDTYIDAEKGKTYFLPKSIAFESMSQSDFARLFDQAVHVVCQKWLSGMDADQLREEIYAMVDRDEQKSLGRRIR